MFKKLFGGKNEAPPVPPPTSSSGDKTISAIQNLVEKEEALEKRKSLLEKRIDQEQEKARDLIKQNKKPQALQCLKKKKLLETEIQNLDNMIMRIAEQRMQLEGQRTQVEVVSSMHTAAMAAKENLKNMKIEKVDKILDEINEVADQNRLITEAFQNPLGVGNDIDVDDLEAELEELQASELDKELLEPAPVPTTKVPTAAEKLPTVPKQKAKEKTAEELELEALEAEMAA